METKVLNIEVRTNSEETQKEFTRLREEIKNTTEQVDKLTETFGENSDEVKQAKGQLDSLRQSYEEMTQSATDLGASFDEVYGEMKPMMARVGEMEDRLYELSMAGKQNTREYQDLITEISRFRQVQMETDMQVDASSQLMSQKLGGAISGVASGFEIAEGASALFGVESEKLQETMVKLQAVMALTQGIQGLREGMKSITALKNTAVTAFKGMTTASKAFMVSGIGLLITAIGVLISKWDDVKNSLTPATAQAKRFEASTRESAEAARHALESFDEYEKTLKRLGYTEDDISKKRKQRFKDAIEQTEKELEASMKVYENQKENLKTVKKFDAWGFNATGRLFFGDEEDAKSQRKHVKELREQLAKLKNDEYAMRQQAKESAKEKKEEQKAELEAQKEKAKASAEKRKEELAVLKQYQKEAKDIFLTEEQREIQAVELNYAERIRLAKKYKQDTTALEIAQMNEINDIRVKYQNQQYDIDKQLREQSIEAQKEAMQKRIELEDAQYLKLQELTLSEKDFKIFQLQQQYDADIEMAKDNADLQVALTKKLNDDIALLDKEANDKKLAETKELQSKRVQMASDALGALMDLNDAFGAKNEAQAKKQFQRNKAFSIAQALINTFQAVTGALTAGGNPIKLATGAQFAEAGIALVSGLASVAKIAKTEFGASSSGGGGGGNGGGGGGAEGGSMMPTFNIVGNNAFSQASQLQQHPVKAYVVSKEVTSQQELDRNRYKNSTW